MNESEFQSSGTPTTQGVSEDDELANGFVYEMDGLQQVVEANHGQHDREAAWTQNIAREEGKLAPRSVALRQLSPTIVAVGQRLEQIRSAEVERYRSKLGTLEPAQREALESLTRGLLKKILLGPARELKARTGAPEQQAQEQLVCRLFGVA
jgi:glutamyl-tRNA reductase